MRKLSEITVDLMFRKGIILEEDVEIYLFGLVFLIRTIYNVASIVFMGYLYGMIYESIMFIVSAMLVRSYSGGFHSDNPILCYVISLTTLFFTLLGIENRILNVHSSFFLMLLAICVLIIYAPLEHQNKTLNKMEKAQYKKRMMWNILKVLILGAIFILVGHSTLFVSIASSIFTIGCMLIIEKIKNLLKG